MRSEGSKSGDATQITERLVVGETGSLFDGGHLRTLPASPLPPQNESVRVSSVLVLTWYHAFTN